jgi:hypothetical protein
MRWTALPTYARNNAEDDMDLYDSKSSRCGEAQCRYPRMHCDADPADWPDNIMDDIVHVDCFTGPTAGEPASRTPSILALKICPPGRLPC